LSGPKTYANRQIPCKLTGMSLIRNVRWPVGLLILLFAASVAALLFNTFSTLALPQRELEIRSDLIQASARMAQAAADLTESTSNRIARSELDKQLRQIAADAMSPFAGVEGGFYLPEQDEFAGYAFPSDPARPGKRPRRSDPPPMEEPYIRVQSRQSLSLPDDGMLANVRDVGPSRVLVVTRPVGLERPALMAVWTMYRLTGPAQLEHQISRYRLSTFLALSGIALALVLTLRLVQTSERQRRQAERLQDDLRRSEHLAALGTMLAGVAHEVRNPLAGIRSTAQLWLRLGPAAYTTESIGTVVQSVDRLNDIVSRLLLFARSDSSDRQPVEINAVLNEVGSLCQAAAKERGIELRSNLEGNPKVLASAGGLHQVFLNLITNGLDVLPAGGRTEISSRVDARARRVEIRFADNGPGVAAAARDHLFEPFFTTRPDGTGLGLAICREIVTQHGGQISLENNHGPGATFLVSLPIQI